MKAKRINMDTKRQEITQKLSGFPVSCYYTTFSPDTYDFIDWHWHVEFQLCMTISGSVLWQTESQQTEVPAGQGIFINSKRVHMARPIKKGTSFFCLDFPPDFLCPVRESAVYEQSVLPVLQEPSLHRKPITSDTGQGTVILQLLQSMADLFDRKETGYEFMLAGNVFQIWKFLRELLSEDLGDRTAIADDRFREMLLYLQKHYAEEIKLNQIADHIGLSRSECCRYFKKQSGQTISEYLLQYRLHESMYLLTETEHTIAQIAQECGFSHQSYYSRKFREQLHMTPRQYRLQKGKEKERTAQ